MLPVLRASLLLLGATALLSSCGGPDAVVDDDGTLELVVGAPEYAIEPGAIRAAAGRIRIVAHNRGKLTHNVRVEEATYEEGVTPADFGGAPTAFGGETTSGVVRLLPGRYRLVCTIGNHDNLGQYALLEVTAAAS